ncbi:2-dehydro-3-deoxy-6-phosphogalactonate aldolase [Pseudoduganella violacea]|uniref:2-dehydro-3-deoxyphosphogalactonate aldolase n=1 Tax=Pseudoduganella violacea TaxID=1715466 RepID=A0A7W5BEB6_9BURK|nr:2-dehydro-3-deoxy-6-phosphogalactonate aldolase [Pseudoduganella violacea]MBB3121544.1 2-dehydro-3-deoxyphosphogalactonate aldolase [Pseudoduganella violacea]
MDIRDCYPPLIAILRGLPAAQAREVGDVLFDAGFAVLEVPLNRPQALESIRILQSMRPAHALIGGGTVLNAADADALHAAGGALMVAPNVNPAVLARCRELGLQAMPGVATPTEALAALEAGAAALKWFPAESLGQAGLKSVLTVLPPDTQVWPVGGVGLDNAARWRQAGAAGLGIGGQLYQPGMQMAVLQARARAFIAAWEGQ